MTFKRARVCKSIIFGFVGGVFEGGGLRVRVAELVSTTGKARSSKVVYYILDAEGEPIGDAATSTVASFVKDFPPKRPAPEQELVLTPELLFDLAPYKRVVKALVAARVIHDAKTTLLPAADAFLW